MAKPKNYLEEEGIEKACKNIDLNIFPNDRCNFNCEYCGSKYAEGAYPMGVDEIKKIIDESIEIGAGKVITFTGGGEPTLNEKKIIELSKHAKEKGLLPRIVTNATYAKTLEDAERVQQYLSGPAITLDSERIRQKSDIADYVAHAIMAAVKSHKVPEVAEVRDDIEARLNFDAEKLTEGDPIFKLKESLQRLYGVELKFETRRNDRIKETLKQGYLDILCSSDNPDFGFYFDIVKTNRGELRKRCVNYQKRLNVFRVDSLTYAKNIYPCCEFHIFKNKPLLAAEEIKEIREKGGNALKEAIKRAYSPEFIKMYSEGCKSCRL